MTKVIRFTAGWCQPCKALAKTLEREGINIPQVVDIDTDEGKTLVQHYNIRSVPTIILDHGNGQVFSFTGVNLSDVAKNSIKVALA